MKAKAMNAWKSPSTGGSESPSTTRTRGGIKRNRAGQTKSFMCSTTSLSLTVKRCDAKRRGPVSIRRNWRFPLSSGMKSSFGVSRPETSRASILNSGSDLRDSIAKRLYRFLDKRFYHRRQWKFNLKELCWEHLGLARSYDAAGLKRKLRPALAELEVFGFLKQ